MKRKRKEKASERERDPKHRDFSQKRVGGENKHASNKKVFQEHSDVHITINIRMMKSGQKTRHNKKKASKKKDRKMKRIANIHQK